MADQRFFKNTGPYTLGELASIAQAELLNPELANKNISDVMALDKAGQDHISFLDNPKYISDFKTTSAGACIIHEKHKAHAPKGAALLISKNPYYSNALVASAFYPSTQKTSISDRAHVSNSAKIGANCTILAGAYIGDNVEIGDNSYIGANASITHAIIGKQNIIHAGVRIGQDGFGFAFSGASHSKVPQLGRVVMGDNVEIGANSCIDRGSGPDTIIGEGTKIDNLVQIGHNVKIGKHCVIAGQAGVAGSTVVDDYVAIGGQVAIAGHLHIGAAAQIAGQSGVTKNIAPKEVVCGMPAVPIKQFHRQAITLQNLAKKKD
jgi:UDP-3-O-[3-hydroxymyristoyl] glucosamine N-acyltransferase